MAGATRRSSNVPSCSSKSLPPHAPVRGNVGPEGARVRSMRVENVHTAQARRIPTLLIGI